MLHLADGLHTLQPGVLHLLEVILDLKQSTVLALIFLALSFSVTPMSEHSLLEPYCSMELRQLLPRVRNKRLMHLFSSSIRKRV